MRTTLLKAVLWGLVGLALLAPTWSPTSQPLGIGRLGESATLLTDGRVLAVGGEINVQGAAASSAEIFDSAKSAWVAAAPMAQARAWHTATMLRNGSVLVVGGSNGMVTALASSELFDFDTASWVDAGVLAVPVAFHTATLLADGTVLVVGRGAFQIFTSSPPGWSASAMAPFFKQHTATLLRNGNVLVVGGLDALNQPSGLAQIYDPVHHTWTAVAGLATPRFAHTATLTPGGEVAVVGGFDGNFTNELATTEMFNVQAQTWTTLPSQLPIPAAEQSATLIADGHLIAAAGMGPNGPLSDANRLDLTQSWNWVPSLWPTVYLQAATVLPTGRVLTVGGQTLSAAGTLPDGGTPPDAGQLPPSNVSGIFDVFCHAVTARKPMASPRWLHTATLLPDATVLVVGGSSGIPGPVLATTEIHSLPDTWSTGPGLAQARRGHSATLLFDGRVLVAGGEATAPLASTEIYDPVAKTWSPGPPLSTARSRHGAVLLPNGKVLLVGGMGPMSTALATTDLFDPATGTWSAGATMANPRMGHFTQLLNDGRVLAIGGFSGSGV
ncbi:MAG TPA: kelch repeat-containing protein, partial [Myxococcaceae bacterium]|nr:kelch repeat-containing protein [Myxococcaceae bacterium]